MKTTITRISAALVLVAAAASANAQSANPNPDSRLYGELGYSAIRYEASGGKVDLGLGTATLGYEFNKNFAIEGSLGTGVTDDDIDVFGVNVNVDVDRAYAAYFKPKMQLTQNLEAYAKVGWAKTKVKANAGGFSGTDSGSDFSYGAGLQYSLSPRAYIIGGYTNLYDKDGATVDGWNVGVGFRF